MRRIRGIRLAMLALVAICTAAPARAVQQSCTVCHGSEGLQLDRSVHARAGVDCVTCHGGVPGVLDETAHGDEVRSLRDPLEGVKSCGECHADEQHMRLSGLRTDQLSLYWSSRHGQALQKDGDPNVATCVSCHGAHEVRSVHDPQSPAHPFHTAETCAECHGDGELMSRYGLDTDSVHEYAESVHAKALLGEGHLSSPTCSDCHGAHGTSPPGVREVAGVCGHCHSVIRDYFGESAHYEAARAGEMGECNSCHGNHLVTLPTVDMLLGDEEGHCGSCHTEEEGGGMQVARALYTELQGFDAMIQDTANELTEAAAKGLFLEREHGYLDEARALLIRARPLTHSLSTEALSELMNRGHAMIDKTLEDLDTKHRSLRDRRIFTGLFLAVTLVLAGILLRYRREISTGLGAGPGAESPSGVEDGG